MADDLRERVLRAVGADGLQALEDARIALVDADELDTYQQDKAQEVERARRIAKAALDASETRGLLVDIMFQPNGCLQVVVCDPQGDEEAMAARVVAAMGVAAPGLPEKIGKVPWRAKVPR